MKKVTYGVRGLIDWRAMIPVGQARLSVHFTGGALTKYGVTPAEFTTTDPVTQRIIEDSAYYRSGKITTLRSTGRHDAPPLSRRAPMQARDAYLAATLPLDTDPKPPTQLTMPCLEDAIDYMAEHHGTSPLSIRTLETLNAEAERHGLQFTIK